MSTPAVLSTSPVNNETAIGVTSPIYIRMSEDLNPQTVTSANCFIAEKATLDIISGTVEYNQSTYIITITPTQDLRNSTTYTVIITNGVQDASKVDYITTYSFEFTTDVASTSTSTPDIPVDVGDGESYSLEDLHVVLTNPEHLASDLPVTSAYVSGEPPLQYIDVTFNNNLDSATIVSGPNIDADQDDRGPAIKVIGTRAIGHPQLTDTGRVEGLIELRSDGKTIRFRFI